MSHGIYASLTRRITTVAAATGLAIAAILVAAAPAAAHDELLRSDPAADATLEALPEQVTLTYSSFPLDEPGATLVEVTDAAGTDLTSGEPIVDGTDVSQALEGPATGAITVVWKIVSSDGHPIDGEFSFTVEGASPSPTGSATPEPTDSAQPTPEDTTEAAATETPAPAPTDDGASPALLWTIAGVVLAAVIAGVAYLLASRARHRRALQRTREGTASGGDRRPDED